MKEISTIISKESPLYPSAWLQLSDAPPCVYAMGNTELLKERLFTVVGSRHTPEQARKACEDLTKELSESFCIVTGTADGGDSAAIRGALQGSGKVICLHAGGFASLPQGNGALLREVQDRGGLLLSVFPEETPVRNFSFEYRNKLLALLGDGTLVVSAGEKSGALITAKYAKKFSKKLFAFPYPPNAASGVGCNELIKKGGYLTEHAGDILQAFGLTRKEKKSVELSPKEAEVLAALRARQEAHATEIAQAVAVPPFKAITLLSALEMKGLAVALGGNRFSAV